MRATIKNIIVEEFSKLILLIEKDFSTNYHRKVNNFLLSQMDEQITANMVFVSSFESKSGFAIEACAKRIARIRFGEENVPAIVNPHNLPVLLDPQNINGQVVVTTVDTNHGDLRGKISTFRANHMAKGLGKSRIESQVTQESIKEQLLPLAEEFKTTEIHTKPVDLAFF